MDQPHFVGWLLVLGLFTLLPALGTRPVRHALGPAMGRLGTWALTELSPVSELDQEAEDLRKVIRREQLCAHLCRLERILATDMSMSATRQIANRIAYRQLLRDLANAPDAYLAVPGKVSGASWSSAALTSRSGRAQPASGVEILDFRWGRTGPAASSGRSRNRSG